jgi:2-aminoadipate transaminase
MIKDVSKFYSKNARNMMRSEIRDLLKLTRQPGVISFGGGLPSPATFPVMELEEITCELLRKKRCGCATVWTHRGRGYAA